MLQYPHPRVVRALYAVIFFIALYTLLPPFRQVQYQPNGHLSHPSLRDILNSTLGFQKVSVVSLPSRTDRRDATSLSAAVTNFEVSYIDGIPDDQVVDKALPPGRRGRFPPGIKGSWRAHMNAIVDIVQHNLTSALIIEDDIDWDIRLKIQLQTFALASRALLQTHNKPHPTPRGIPLSSPPKTTPYGDNWDILWLGHCGFEYPERFDLDSSSISHPKLSNRTSPILILNDFTVPQNKFLKPHPFASPDPLAATYPPHTRIVAPSTANVCSLAYALTQRGARKLLYEFGIRQFTTGFDLMLRDFCAPVNSKWSSNPGSEIEANAADATGDRDRVQEEWQRDRVEGMVRGTCVTVQPPLFNHHYPEGGGASDIQGHGGGFITKMQTPYIRLSTRMNLERLVKGEKELVDQFPDEVREDG